MLRIAVPPGSRERRGNVPRNVLGRRQPARSQTDAGPQDRDDEASGIKDLPCVTAWPESWSRPGPGPARIWIVGGTHHHENLHVPAVEVSRSATSGKRHRVSIAC